MKKILFVDDDPNILSALQRELRKRFKIETALGPGQGLSAIESADPFAVVVADMNMPGMNGVEFLKQVKIKTPHITRIMLTGNADQSTAVLAVNEGNIFRFLTKPCSAEELIRALEDGVRQYELVTAEKELLEKTLSGSIKVLVEILSMVEPQSFGRAQILREHIRRLAQCLGASETWEFEAAALLSPIGYVTVPPEVTLKYRLGRSLSATEQDIFTRLPEISSRLLAHIPRLETVARIVLYQNKRFDGSGFPNDEVAGQNVPLGARLLKVVSDLAQAETKGAEPMAALEQLKERAGWYDPKVLAAAFVCFGLNNRLASGGLKAAFPVSLKELSVGHVLVDDVMTRSGMMIVPAQHRVTPTLLERLHNFSRLMGIKEPIYVAPANDKACL